MQTVIKEGESVLSPRHLVRIGEWAKELSNTENRVWTKSDSKLALLIQIEQKRLLKLHKKRREEIGFIDF